MTRLEILEFPDPRLRTRAQPVEQFDAALGQLIDDMFATMYAAPGIGLAATQVNVHRRLHRPAPHRAPRPRMRRSRRARRPSPKPWATRPTKPSPR